MREFVSVERINSLKSGIEAKTGGSYTDLTAGVQALVDGYGQGSGGGADWLQKATHLTNFFDGATLPETVLVNAPNVVDAANMFKAASGMRHVILNLGTLNNFNYVFNLQYISSGDRILETVEINANFDNVTQMNQPFYQASKLREIKGSPLPPIMLASQNYMNWLNGLSALEEVRLMPNKCGTDIYLPNPTKHSDETIISIANTIKMGTTQTITLNATPKSRCNEILGTVSQVTQEDGTTYDFFTADSAGTVTLTEFITVTKGWTLA